MSSPCYQCEKRCAGCHSTCADYIEFAGNKRRENEQRKAYLKDAEYFISAAHKVAKKNRRK